MAEACTTGCPLLLEAIKRVEDNSHLARDGDKNAELFTHRAEKFEELLEIILSKCVDCPGINVSSYDPPESQCQAPDIAQHLPALGPGNSIFLSRLVRKPV